MLQTGLALLDATRTAYRKPAAERAEGQAKSTNARAMRCRRGTRGAR
ncbi:hypothetical protein BUC_4757 [Burkholderia pseudomallei 576]|nr:hypothetical protein BUC_4757 [Burkholderia pseudomallei 576]